jgi:hypothetical protein
MAYSQYPLQPEYYQYPPIQQKQNYFDAGYCLQYNTQPLYPFPDIIPYMSYSSQDQQPKQCYGCLNGIENQEAHFGGCIEDPSIREYIQLPSQSPKSTLTLKEFTPPIKQVPEVPQEPTLDYTSINITNKDYEEDEEFIDILELTKKVWQPKQYKKFFEDPILAFKAGVGECEIINEYNKDIDINDGDWIYTYYHIPLDCLHKSKLKSYLQDYIYKATPEIAEKLEHSIGSEIRYNIPTNGRFQIPRENGEFYYGHPALYNPKTQSRIETTSENAKFLKRAYEKNQKRISKISKVFPIKHYDI